MPSGPPSQTSSCPCQSHPGCRARAIALTWECCRVARSAAATARRAGESAHRLGNLPPNSSMSLGDKRNQASVMLRELAGWLPRVPAACAASARAPGRRTSAHRVRLQEGLQHRRPLFAKETETTLASLILLSSNTFWNAVLRLGPCLHQALCAEVAQCSVSGGGTKLGRIKPCAHNSGNPPHQPCCFLPG